MAAFYGLPEAPSARPILIWLRRAGRL